MNINKQGNQRLNVFIDPKIVSDIKAYAGYKDLSLSEAIEFFLQIGMDNTMEVVLVKDKTPQTAIIS